MNRRPANLVVPMLLLTCSASAVETTFVEKVWGQVASHECLKCHKTGGDAEDSDFILSDPAKVDGEAREAAMRQNRNAFAKMAREVAQGDQSRLLLKAQGKLKHGGKQVVKPDSAAFRILADFVREVTSPVAKPSLAMEKNEKPFFEGVVMLDDPRLLRRATLSLAGRLPTDSELKSVSSGGLMALSGILDDVMKEGAFYDRLREGFNDIFLTLGADGNADQTFLSYDHFPQRHWYQKWEFKDIPEEKDRKQAGYKMAREYREALHGEPMKLIEHIVRNDKPFTEIVTADYVMLSPYSARGYGVFEEIKGQFKDVNDPFEYIPVRLHALKGRSKQQDQESATGFYPHAGLLSTFQWLCRYPTTETNRNRLRARMYYQHFLGVDVLELAARVTDAAAVTAKYKVPTMEASECVVCHKTLDPVSSLFQDYWKFADQGVYGRRKDGWFTDMFQAGFEGENMPPEERWRSLQWLGERTAKDPRFAVAMVEHAYYILTGRKALLPPKDLEDPLHDAKRRAYVAQRRLIEDIATRFTKNGFLFKQVIKDLVLSDFYRADGVTTVVSDAKRLAELDDIGITRMLAPEQVERKIAAVFGKGWNRLHTRDGGLGMLYGGIDSKEVTERATDPSGAMGAIMRTMSNDVACKNVALDFTRPAAERLFFRDVEPETLPGTAEADAKIKRTIMHLHERVLGRADALDSDEVTRTFELFSSILTDAQMSRREPQESYYCRPDPERTPVADPHYTIRAWRGVMTYLLRRLEFLYE